MRIRNKWIAFAFLILCALVESCLGAPATSTPTPLPVTDPATYRDLQNLSQAIANPTINSATVSSETVKFSSMTSLTVSSLTVTGPVSIPGVALTAASNTWASTQTFNNIILSSGVSSNGTYGNLNNVLVSTGTASAPPVWTNGVRVGTLQLIAVSTPTPGVISTVTFSNLNGIYASEFIVVLATVSPSTASNNTLHMQISQNGSFVSSGYSYNSLSQFHGSPYNSDGAEGQTDWIISRGAGDVCGGPNCAIDGEVRIFAPQLTIAGPRRFSSDLIYLPTGSTTVSHCLAGGLVTSTGSNIDAIRIYFVSGATMQSGVFYLYALIGLPNGF